MRDLRSSVAMFEPVRLTGQVQDRLHVIDGNLVVQRGQDCEGVLESAKHRRLNGLTGTRDEAHVARIPKILLEKWSNDEGVRMDDPAFDDVLARKLNDSEYAHLRVWEGRF
jgi:hypothetical protein